MFNGAFFLRAIVAAVAVAFIWALLPPFIVLLQVHPPEALVTIIKLGVAAFAFFYVVTGGKPLA